MKTNPRSGRAAFTLIELLAVITIIIILAGLVTGGLSFANERQAKEKAKVQIALLTKALEEYKLDMGRYPETDNAAFQISNKSDQSKVLDYGQLLYQALFYEGYEYSQNPNRPDTTPPRKATRIYLPELDPASNKQGWVFPLDAATANIKDPWGNGYCYRSATTGSATGTVTTNDYTQNPDFDLWSMGKDGFTNGGRAASDMNDPSNRDNIR